MFNYTIRKLLGIIPTLLIVTFIIYVGVELMPGDVLDFMIPMDQLSEMTEAEKMAVRESLGLNAPLVIRYFHWIGNAFRGNLGYSLQNSVPVSELLLSRLPATLELTFAALIISTFLGTILGVISALRKGKMEDNVLTFLGMMGVATPQFLVGTIFIIIFGLQLSIFPVGGRAPATAGVMEKLSHLLMPALVMGVSMTAGVMRYTRSSMLEAMDKDYVTTARSKGLSEFRINILHGFRTAAIPVVILIGFRLPMLVSGSVVIEEVFQWPGIGLLFTNAIRSQNTPVIMGVALLIILVVLFSSLIMDLITAALDPRVKLS